MNRAHVSTIPGFCMKQIYGMVNQCIPVPYNLGRCCKSRSIDLARRVLSTHRTQGRFPSVIG
jgi:hypothetical protein